MPAPKRLPEELAMKLAMNVDQLPITAQGEVAEGWLDEMGHMNVMWYTHMFSRGVWGFFQTFGFSREYMERELAGSFALEMHVRYLSECRLGQKLSVRSRAVARSAKRIHHVHFLVKDGSAEGEGSVVAAIGEMVSAHVDLKVRRQSPFPPELAEAYDRMAAAHQALAWPAPICGVMKP
jgi:acyl-CoA thioester hydrolase